MPSSSNSGSPDESFFNDLSQLPAGANGGDTHDAGANGSADTNGATTTAENDAQARPKRIACVLCRKRKLRCDGARPACGTCKRLSHDCAYDEVRKKSGPKRGYVKLLEARLQQVETLLKNQDPMADGPRRGSDEQVGQPFTIPSRPIPLTASENMDMPNIDPQLLPQPDPTFVGAKGRGEEQFSWEMIGLGLEEPLPPQETINDLHRIYFEKIHPSMPIVHRPRYMAAMNLAPQMRPPVALRYMMWCMAASVTDKYEAMQEHFYHRARKYLQADEMRGHGEPIITVGQCQAWLLVGMYEFKLMYFPRAWLSVGRACRLSQMMGLHRLDGAGLDVKQCIPPPRDWTEREERRRTFWMAFCEDRYASIGTGWPMTIDERDIMTNLPASEEAFEKSKPHPTTSLADVIKPGGAASLTQLGGVVLMACLFGRNLTHLHRPTPEDQDDNLEGAFWQRHREMEGILANTGLSLPDNLRLPAGLPDSNVIFLNMNIHTSAICLHQAAIFKADRFKLPANVGSESRVRCMTAAAEIARIMRMLVHLDLSSMNPFISFCLYVAARVFVQYLKFRPKDQQMISSLQFLLHAMHALKKKNPLTESFIVQLDLDLVGAGIDVGQPKADYNSSNLVGNTPQRPEDIRNTPAEAGDLTGPVPVFELSELQGADLQSVPGTTQSRMAIPHFHTRGYNGPPDVGGGGGGGGGGAFSFMSKTQMGVGGAQSQSHASFAYLDRSSSSSTDLPHRQTASHLGAASSTNGALSPSLSNDMDTSTDANGANLDHATPNTDVSRHNSNTSFTPPSTHHDDITHKNAAAAAFVAGLYGNGGTSNSKTGSIISAASVAPLGSSAEQQPYFPVSTDDMDFTQIHNHFFSSSEDTAANGAMPTQHQAQQQQQTMSGGEDFAFPAGWDISMGGAGGTGLTPMVEQASWTNMMDGWEGMGPPHPQQTDAFGRRI